MPLSQTWEHEQIGSGFGLELNWQLSGKGSCWWGAVWGWSIDLALWLRTKWTLPHRLNMFSRVLNLVGTNGSGNRSCSQAIAQWFNESTGFRVRHSAAMMLRYDPFWRCPLWRAPASDSPHALLSAYCHANWAYDPGLFCGIVQLRSLPASLAQRRGCLFFVFRILVTFASAMEPLLHLLKRSVSCLDLDSRIDSCSNWGAGRWTASERTQFEVRFYV